MSGTPRAWLRSKSDFDEVLDSDIGDVGVDAIDGTLFPASVGKRAQVTSRGGQRTWSRAQIEVRSRSHFVLAGLGEKPEKCGIQRVTHWNVDAEGPRILYGNLHCGRLTCPNCYSHSTTERTFTYAVVLEAYARCYGERPAAVTVSVRPSSTEGWTWDDFNTRLHRRGNRRLRSLGAHGGLRVFHPFRIRDDIKGRLRAAGYGRDEGKGGLWRGVREDALGFVDWREYVKWGPHDHQLVFPSFLKENKTPDFLVRKYSVLGAVRNVVAHIRYLLSHIAKVEGTKDKPTTNWGLFVGKDQWRPEDHLPKEELDAIKSEVATLLGMAYNVDTGDLEYIDPTQEDLDWRPIWELPSNMKNEDFCEVLSSAQYDFFYTLVSAMLKTPIPDGLELDPMLVHEEIEGLRPDDVRAFYVTEPPDDGGNPCGDPEEAHEFIPENEDFELASTPRPLPNVEEEVEVVVRRLMFVCRRCGAAHFLRKHPWVCDVNRGGCGRVSGDGREETAFDPVQHAYDSVLGRWIPEWGFLVYPPQYGGGDE